MDLNTFLGLFLSIPLAYYAIFKLKKDEDLSAKLLVLTISITGFSAAVAKLLFENTIYFRIIVIVGLLANFSVITVLAWKFRKDPEKRYGSYIWMGGLIFIFILLIIIFFLNSLGTNKSSI